jgi:hypothetical protein
MGGRFGGLLPLRRGTAYAVPSWDGVGDAANPTIAMVAASVDSCCLAGARPTSFPRGMASVTRRTILRGSATVD